jgi:hypothetical protein
MWHYIISGAGPFPTGLLPLVKAWPADADDADAMFNYRGALVRRITLLSPFAPERDLWRDAGWEVQSCKWDP